MKNEFDYLNDVRMDFSVYGEESLSEKEFKAMKRNFEKKNALSVRKRVVFAAAAAVVALTGTAFASGFAGTIIRQISTGDNTIIQTDPTEKQVLPDKLQGMFYDENGTPLGAVSSEDFDNLYDSDGKKLNKQDYAEIIAKAYGGEVETSEDGKISISMPDDKDADETEHDFSSIDEAKSEASFNLKTPSSLPEGYSLNRAYTYPDDDGTWSGDYITLEYKKGKDEIIIFERRLSEETRFTISTENEIEEIDINGSKAAVDGDNGVSWETADGVSVMISTHGSLSKAEMIEFAKGIK